MSLKISVVIPSCGRENDLIKLLESLSSASILPYEIIIVIQSQNTINLSGSKINKNLVNIIKDNGTGAARARNIGWGNASGDIISFIDDDAIACKDWVKNIIESFNLKQFNTGIVSGKIIPTFQEVNQNWKLSDKLRYILPSYDQGENIELFKNNSFPPSVNYSVRKNILEKTGGFNEKLGVNSGKNIQIFGEDSDLSQRIRKLGYEIIYNPGVAVYHPVPLNRQCNEFVKKRLFSEGLTYVYLKRLEHDSIAFRLIQIILTILKYFKNILLPVDDTISDENKNIYKGRLFGLIHSMKFLSR